MSNLWLRFCFGIRPHLPLIVVFYGVRTTYEVLMGGWTDAMFYGMTASFFGVMWATSFEFKLRDAHQHI